mgnify:CR=1 FL=1
MHNEEKTFRFSMRKPFKYKNFFRRKRKREMINRNRRLEILSHVQPSVQKSKNWRSPKRIAFDRGKKYRISECAKKGAKKGAEKELKKGAERKQIMLELLSEYLIMTQTEPHR